MTLKDLQTRKGHFTISAFDHRSSLVKLFQLDETQTQLLTEHMIELKSLLMRTFSPISSAVLTDPIYGKATIEDKAKNCGLLMSLEESGYDSDKAELPTLVPDWGIEGIKGYQGAAKFLLYFHPEEKNAQAKIEQVTHLYEQAKAHKVPFLVEVVLYQIEDEAEFKKKWHVLQLETIQIFGKICDVLKIEYPGLQAETEEHSGEMCQMISQASPVPWIILSRGMEFQKFAKAVEISMRSGAAGFAVGRAVWQEIDQFGLEKTGSWAESMRQTKDFLENTATDRLKHLIELVENS
jgi:tagatose 1,6-diphosphate aldolase